MDVIIYAIVALLILSLVFGAILGFASVTLKVDGDPIVEQIDDLLPQNQCAQCGYPGCRPYAEAVAAGEATNKCTPGGQATANALANLLGVDPEPLEAEGGTSQGSLIAYIRESECIGCTKCIQACPVDAIVGAAKYLHTVIGDECTGCDLCVKVCPVDCIDMNPIEVTTKTWNWALPSKERSKEPMTGLIATDLRGEAL